MRKMLCVAVSLVLLAAAMPASAQSFGEVFPLTNTRYEAAVGTPRLAANGSDFYLFWAAERKIRATSLAGGVPRLGHVVFDTSGPFDVAWTGEAFLIVTSRPIAAGANEANIVGRLLNADAQPLGDEFLIAERGREPRISIGTDVMVMTYRGAAGDTRVLVRGRHGENTGAASWSVPESPYGYAVATNGAGFVVAVANAKETRAISLNRQGLMVSEDAESYPFGAVSFREVALASNGKEYLLAWCTQTGGGKGGMLLDENGAFGTPVLIGGGFSRSLSAAWTGSDWRIAWESRQGDGQTRTRVLPINRDVTTWSSEEKTATFNVGNPSMAAMNGRVMVAWSQFGVPGGPVSVSELPLASHQPRVATFAATQQTLLATASSANGTLMVWTEHSIDEGKTLYTGVRTHDGQWNEQKLRTDAYAVNAASAASDGTGFAVITSNGDIQKLFRLDAQGRFVAPAPAALLPGVRNAISWNGTNYGIITAGRDTQGRLGLERRLLSRTGVISAPVTIPFDAAENAFSGRLSLASNGEGFLLVGDTPDCGFLLCGRRSVKGIRLGANLQRTEAEDLTLDSVYGELAGAVWNGNAYVVAWRGTSDLLFTARVPAAAASSIQIASADADILARSIAAMPNGTVAVAGPARTSSANRVAFLGNGGGIAQSFDIDSSVLTGTPLLSRLPDGVAYAVSSVQNAAPHHGTSRVMMALARPSVTSRPNPPHLSAHLHDGAIVVDWSASAGTVNGFRLEYRIDNGAWNEVEEWFPPSANHRAIPVAFGTKFDVRMRAFNDGGTSGYSEASTARPIRRRAAGH